MHTIERTITVPTALDEVWDYLVDFTHTEEWDPPTRSTTRVLGDGDVGTVYRNITTMLGREIETEYTVVDLEARQLLRLEGRNSGMRLRDTVTFAGSDGSTTVTYHAEFHPRGMTRLLSPLLPLALKRLGDKTAAQLENCLRDLATEPARRDDR